MKSGRMLLLAAIALCCVPVASVSGAARRPITETDLLRFQWIADPQISPDGRQVAWVLVAVNAKEDRYETSLWIVSTRGGPARRLTAGPRDTAPRWSPDSRTIAFLRSSGEKEKPQIHLLSMDGGEARRLTEVPRGASAPVWSPDRRTLAFTSDTTAEEIEEKRREKEREAAGEKSEKARKSDVRVVTRAIYRANGEGWLDPDRHDHVWTVPAGAGEETAEARPLTSGSFDDGELVWSPDGSRIYFTSDRVEEPYYAPEDSNLYSVPAGGGEIRTVVDIAGPVTGASPSPDGSRIAFSGFLQPPKVQSYTRGDLFLFEDGKARGLLLVRTSRSEARSRATSTLRGRAGPAGFSGRGTVGASSRRPRFTAARTWSAWTPRPAASRR